MLLTALLPSYPTETTADILTSYTETALTRILLSDVFLRTFP